MKWTSTPARWPRPNQKPYSQKFWTQIQGKLQSSEDTRQQHGDQGLQRQHLDGRYHRLKRTTLTEQVADDYEQLAKQGRFSKQCIPRGYIPDLNWTKIHEDSDQPIRPVKQDEDPTETTTTPVAPPEIEEPPSSHLRSKTKQQTTSIQQDLLECNPSTMDPLECNPAQIEANEVQIVPGIEFLYNGHAL